MFDGEVFVLGYKCIVIMMCLLMINPSPMEYVVADTLVCLVNELFGYLFECFVVFFSVFQIMVFLFYQLLKYEWKLGNKIEDVWLVVFIFYRVV